MPGDFCDEAGAGSDMLSSRVQRVKHTLPVASFNNVNDRGAVGGNSLGLERGYRS